MAPHVLAAIEQQLVLPGEHYSVLSPEELRAHEAAGTLEHAKRIWRVDLRRGTATRIQ